MTRQALTVARLVGEGVTMSGWNVGTMPQKLLVEEIIAGLREVEKTGEIETLTILVGENVMDDHPKEMDRS